MNLEKLIESHYAPKKGKEILFDLIHKKLNEQAYIPIPQLTPAIGAGEEAKKLDSKTKNLNELVRKVLSTPFMDSLKKDNSIGGRIKLIRDYQYGLEDLTIPEFIGISAFLQEFSKIVREFDNTEVRLAGYQFELLMSVFFNGTELFGTMITDFRAVVNGRKENISAKFIKNQTIPEVKGNIHNFIKETFNPTNLIYLICLKNVEESLYDFYEIFIDPEQFDDIFNWDSPRAKELFDDNPIIGSQKFQRRMTGEGAKEYGERLIYRIDQIGIMYKEKKIEIKSQSPQLFSKEFCKEVFKIGSPEHAGTLDLSEALMKHTNDFYKKSVIERVGQIFNKLSSLNKNLLEFFISINKTSDPATKANSILNEIEKFKKLFIYIIEKDLRL